MAIDATRLILIRHAMPIVDDSRPSATWKLSESGRNAAKALASDLSAISIQSIVSSEEPKAIETAAIIAETLGISWSTAPGLHEHERGRLDWLGEEAWHAQIRRFFDRPRDVVFGYESARDSLARFKTAVESVLDQPEHRTGTIAIVSHGTVMSLYAADKLGDDPYVIWKNLDLPDYVELTSGTIDID